MKASMQKCLCEALFLHCMFRVMLKPSLRRDYVSKRASDSRIILYPRLSKVTGTTETETKATAFHRRLRECLAAEASIGDRLG